MSRAAAPHYTPDDADAFVSALQQPPSRRHGNAVIGRDQWPDVVTYLQADHTLEEAGKRFGVTRERIRQIANMQGYRDRPGMAARMAKAEEGARLRLAATEARKAFRAARVAALAAAYRELGSTAAVAERFKMVQPHVDALLRPLGIIRPRNSPMPEHVRKRLREGHARRRAARAEAA